MAADDEPGLAGVAAGLDLRFDGEQVLLAGADVAAELRQEQVGSMASRISGWPAVRGALEALQLSFRRLPGLVADRYGDVLSVQFAQAVPHRQPGDACRPSV